ncbi:MAG TPA: vanadium-dependent haloperoxidase [Chitinophagaceae bacterium]|nr:vanadium-dependent haloperoxidase [Chitinophagaceae bacterium]
MKRSRVSFTLLLMFIGISCKQGSAGDYRKYSADPLLYCKTVKKLNDVVLENNFPPMIGSRNYVYANIAAYECVAAGSEDYNSLSGQIRHLPPMPQPGPGKEIDFSLAALFAFTKVGNAVTFPEGSMMNYYEELKKNAVKQGIPSDVLSNSMEFSDSIVAAVLRWSKGDNYAQTRSAEKYTVRDEAGRWIPTPPMYGTAVEPHWCEVRTMVIDSASQFMPARPPKYDLADTNSEFYKALLEVKNIGDSLTDEQKHIADFWDDNPFKMNVSGHIMFATKKFSPPGHWMNIVGIAAKSAGADFNTTVAAYTETAIAVYDAFISCWDEKFRSNLVRPETVINQHLSDSWRPYIQTPPFPSYTSGHATNSAAAAEVMTKWFGDTLSFTDTSLLEFGIANRQIKSFRGAAEEAALSRLYGGIHYRFDNENGAEAGKRLGEYIVTRLKMKNNQQLTTKRKS